MINLQHHNFNSLEVIENNYIFGIKSVNFQISDSDTVESLCYSFETIHYYYLP